MVLPVEGVAVPVPAAAGVGEVQVGVQRRGFCKHDEYHWLSEQEVADQDAAAEHVALVAAADHQGADHAVPAVDAAADHHAVPVVVALQ